VRHTDTTPVKPSACHHTDDAQIVAVKGSTECTSSGEGKHVRFDFARPTEFAAIRIKMDTVNFPAEGEEKIEISYGMPSQKDENEEEGDGDNESDVVTHTLTINKPVMVDGWYVIYTPHPATKTVFMRATGPWATDVNFG